MESSNDLSLKQSAAHTVAVHLIHTCRNTGDTRLNLAGLGLSDLPQELGRLTSLKILDLTGNQLTEVPSIIFRLRQLEELRLSKNKITHLPPEFGHLESLKKLDLDWNELASIPQGVLALKYLSELSLSHNNLVTITSVCSLPTLVSLNLDFNQIKILPSQIGFLGKLKHLSLSNNQLKSTPYQIGLLKTLEELHLDNNQIQELTSHIGRLKSLKQLILNNNLLESLPSTVGKLVQLRELRLYKNRLSVLPVEIGSLSKLKLLSLSDNLLRRLPNQFSHLTALKELYVANNRLTSLPEGIGSLTYIERLILAGNRLESLPRSLGGLQSLKELTLHGNPSLDVPPELLGPTYQVSGENNPPTSPQKILNHLAARQAQGSRELNEVRLVLVGRGGSGKTSLVQRLIWETFHHDQEETKGIALSDWIIDELDGQPVTAHVWDFAGQVITHSMHRYFLSHRTIYLLVLTQREDSAIDDAEYWLKLIQSYGSADGTSPPVLVALNKWTSSEVNLDRGALVEKYPFIEGFVQTDCGNPPLGPLGIDALKASIRKVLDSPKVKPWVRQPYPARWWNLKEKLQQIQQRQPHLDFASFEKLCAECDVPDPQEAGRDFHALGLALNYGLDPKWKDVLEDTTVLRANWVTHHCYSLIRYSKSSDGVLMQKKLRDILSVNRDGVAGEIDPKMHLYLMRLMERFEAAYPIGETYPPNEWLIPLGLPNNQPQGTELFRNVPATEAVRLRYSYLHNLPPGLIAQFIVRTHALMENHQQWASGTILTFDGARALIRSTSKSIVEVTVIDGTETSRRDLAGLCRDEIRALNAQVAGIDVNEETEVDAQGKTVWMDVESLEQDELKGKSTSGIATKNGTLLVATQKELDEFGTEEARLPEGPRHRAGEREPEFFPSELHALVGKQQKRQSKPKPKIFISYSHKDERHRKTLELYLEILKNRGLLCNVWHDRRIQAGTNWHKTIQDELAAADVVIFLTSPSALESSYISDDEMAPALERYVKQEIRLIPIILHECDWRSHFANSPPLAELQNSGRQVPLALPRDGKPIRSFIPQSKAWDQVLFELDTVLRTVKAKLM